MIPTSSLKRMELIEDIISNASNVTIEEMRSHNRMREYVDARMVVWTIAKDYLGFSYPFIAKIYKRDHTTIIYGVEKMRNTPAYQSVIDRIQQLHPGLLDKKSPSEGRPVENWKF